MARRIVMCIALGSVVLLLGGCGPAQTAGRQGTVRPPGVASTQGAGDPRLRGMGPGTRGQEPAFAAGATDLEDDG